MRQRIIRHIAFMVALLWSVTASAQYYTWGADPENLSWRSIKSDKISIIYPTASENLGYKMMHYVKAVQPTIDFGFRYGPMDIPFIIHPENLASNGMVMWLPKRVEILSAPSINSYSMPWLKQLSAHEYRHAVQYNNLNHGWVKAFSYILGQQSSTIGLLFMPLWGLEGDAVISETSMSTYGRALQPSFTLHYRAYSDDLTKHKNLDKWFCGSFKEYIPDHYQLGYQITAYANTKYNENIWDTIVDYAVHHPYVILTTYFGLRKFYNTNTRTLTYEAFSDLNNFWKTLPAVTDSSQKVATPKQRSYTSYNYPIWFGSKSIISVKESLDTHAALVRTNVDSGNEQRICYIGNLSTRPALQGSRIWWTEYRRSLLYQQKVNSRLCYTDLDTGKTKSISKYDNVLYPTPITDSNYLAWVEYNIDGSYDVAYGDEKSRKIIAKIEFGTEIHSLAFDNSTKRLYFIATDDNGMWIGRINSDGSTSAITQPAYITISDLRAQDGMLYFGSIASGKDEAHCYDLTTNKQYRITASKYGSFSPYPAPNGKVVMTTFDKNGYQLALQQLDTLHTVEYSNVPANIVNPPRKKWNTINLDNIRYTTTDSISIVEQHRPRRYSKLTHLINIHSWAPASYDPFDLTEEGAMDFNLGATIMSQNLLSNTEGFATWGWNKDNGHCFKGALRYYGLGVNLTVSGSYGGKQQMYSIYTYEKNPENGKYEIVFPDAPEQKKYFNISASASLPLYLQRGYHTRILAINTSWSYSNGLVAKTDQLKIESGQITNLATIGYSQGLHLLQAGIGFQDQVQLAHKNFLPPFGYILSANYAFNPANTDFGQLLSLYGKVYIPGFIPHHSLSLAMLYQNSIGGFESKLLASNMSFKSARILPRGFHLAEIENRNYIATSVNYQFPICYPDGGIPSILYFKRIRLNLGGDYASFDDQYFIAFPNIDNVALRDKREHIFSYGGDITFDINLFSMPASATTAVTLSLYKPHNKKGVFFSAGVGFPF